MRQYCWYSIRGLRNLTFMVVSYFRKNVVVQRFLIAWIFERWFSSDSPYRRWVNAAFVDFEVAPTNQAKEKFQTEVWKLVRPLIDELKVFSPSKDAGQGWGRKLLNTCEVIAGMVTGHRQCRLLSYNDVFFQVASLRIFIENFSAVKCPHWNDSLDFSRWLTDQFSDSRSAQLVRGRFELEAGNLDQALQSARNALAVESSCPRAQQLLFDAYTAKSKLEPDLRQNEISMADLKGRFCSEPFKTLATIDNEGKSIAFICNCGGWLPYSAGNILQAENVDSVWNSAAAMEIRRSILDGDFSYCSRSLCPYIVKNTLPKREEVTEPLMRRYIDENLVRLPEVPQLLQLSHDSTCNLACPTCRKEILTADAATRDRLADARERVILPLLKQMQGTMFVTGWGDPFASKHYRGILERLNSKDFPNLQVSILTNGLLLNRTQWERLSPMHEMINQLAVSVDAATAITYENVRRPGRWAQLMGNLEFLSELRRAGDLQYFAMNFVVQEANFREIPDFIQMGIKLGVDGIRFQKLWNFGANSQSDFFKTNVASPVHPLYPELLKIFGDPLMKNPIVNAFNLSSVVGDA